MNWKRGRFYTARGEAPGHLEYAAGPVEPVSIVWRGREHHFGRAPVRGVVSEHWGVYNRGRGRRPFCLVHLSSGCAAGYFRRQKDATKTAEEFHAAHPEYARRAPWGGLGLKALGRRSAPTILKLWKCYGGARRWD